jgi:hypothetical protein
MSMTSSATPARNRPTGGAVIVVSRAGSDPYSSPCTNITTRETPTTTAVTCMTR